MILRNLLCPGGAALGMGLGARIDHRVAAWVGIASFALLVACSSTPTPPAGTATDKPLPAITTTPSPQAAFEQKQRDRALAFERQKRLGDAAIAWEILATLRPDVPEYHDHQVDVLQQIDTAVAERLPRAAAAAKKGDLDGATQQYLAVLALQPQNDVAAEALRSIERDRNKRDYLGKLSRYTITKRAIADAEMASPADRLAGRNDVEHASLLASDGQFDDAIGLLERRISIDRKDASARRLLANVYYRKAEAIAPQDKKGAIAALEKSARLDSSDARAAVRLKQLKGVPPAAAQSAASSAAH